MLWINVNKNSLIAAQLRRCVRYFPMAQLSDELTDVEKAYLDNLRQMQKLLKDGGGDTGI